MVEPIWTEQQILARIEERKPKDVFGFEWREYLSHLGFEAAKPFLAPDESEEGWGEALPVTTEALNAEMLDYMPFAWQKANNCRGISAERNIAYFVAWTWLAGDTPLSREIDSIPHMFYGKPVLCLICRHYKWEVTAWDDGQWRNGEEESPITRTAAMELFEKAYT